jgi:hypothetical protein
MNIAFYIYKCQDAGREARRNGHAKDGHYREISIRQRWQLGRIMGPMKFKVKFWKWTLLAGALGLLDPAVVISQFFLFGKGISEFEFRLWPSSIMFMGLDGPTPSPTSTVVSVYAVAIIENVVLYAVLGALVWPLVYVLPRLRGSRGGPPISN